MFIETAKLIDQTIHDLEVTAKNLETLAELLAEEVDEAIHHPTEISADAEKCHEAQIAIDALIPKLRAAQPIRANVQPASAARRGRKRTV